MGDELVSVIVLTFRKFQNIEKNINSILNQNYNNIEIIISDDSSSNFDEEKIQNLFKKRGGNIKNVTIRTNSTNEGTVKNFNNAIIQSRGNIIIPLSEDDCFADDKVIDKIVTRFKKNESLILTAKRKVNGENTILPTDNQIKHFKRKKYLLTQLIYGNFISGSCTYYRRDIFKIIGYFDERYKLLEDYPYYINALVNKINIDFLNYVTIEYNPNGVSGVKTINKQLRNDSVFLFNQISKNKTGEFSFLQKRIARKNMYLAECYNSNSKRAIIKLKYIDVKLIQLLRRVVERYV